MKKSFSWMVFAGLWAVLLFAVTIAVSVGSAGLSAADSLRMLLGRIFSWSGLATDIEISSIHETIVWEVRLPRILLSALAGTSLSAAGAVYQGVFLNSLADPHILGVSSGAALGAALAMAAGTSFHVMGFGIIGLAAFAGALLTVFFVYQIAGIGGGVTSFRMLLAGTAVGTMLSSLISLIMAFQKEQMIRVYMWTMGSFSSAAWSKVWFLAAITIPGCIMLTLLAGKLNVMMLGEEDAKCLGIDTDRMRKILILISSLLVAACVSVSGIIGFTGLVIPHCVRMLGGTDNRRVLPYGCLSGAVFMVFCDTIARTAAAPMELPAGVVTSIFGTPYFVWLILKKGGSRQDG